MLANSYAKAQKGAKAWNTTALEDEIWTREGGIEASISPRLTAYTSLHAGLFLEQCAELMQKGELHTATGLDGYSCYSYEISDFIEVGAGIDRACRGETVADDSSSHKTVQTVASLSQCKQLCRNTAVCTGRDICQKCFLTLVVFMPL